MLMLAKAVSMIALALSLGQMSVDACVQGASLGGNLFLVNVDYRIGAGYEPYDLRRPSVRLLHADITLRDEAAQALEELFAAASDEAGHTLRAVSGYRSYSKQSVLFARKRKSVGEARARLLVAPPGASEHQLGLAVDIAGKTNATLSSAFGKSREGIWVANNAHRFGFIIRYKAEWTAITGYAYEPWHLRYVGKEHAERMHTMNIPLESYIGILSELVFASRFQEGG